MKSKKDFDCLSDQIPIGGGKYIDFLKQSKEVSFTYMYRQTFNIASDSEANITTSCEMEFFNFLWLI